MSKAKQKVHEYQDPAAFCRAWNAAESLKELAEKTGVKERALASRAAAYRLKHDVALKYFRSGRNVDWDALRSEFGSFSNGAGPAKPNAARPKRPKTKATRTKKKSKSRAASKTESASSAE